MHKGLRVLLVCTLALVFAWSLHMLRLVGVAAPWLAVLLMFYFLGLAKVAEPLFMLRVPRALHPLRDWELRGTALRNLGVLAYGKLLSRTPLRYLNLAVYVRGGSHDLGRLLLLTRSAEAAHFWAALLLLPFVGYALYRSAWQVAAWFVLAEMLVNIYPLLHLRHLRGRLERVIARHRG